MPAKKTPKTADTAPKPETVKKTSKAKTPPKEVKAEPVVEVKETPKVEVVDKSKESGIAQDFTSFLTNFQELATQLTSLKNQFKALEKKTIREMKIAQKATEKRKRKSGNRSPSGFVKPTKISPELAEFLGKEQGTEMARTDVTREINAYIRANQLQDPKNGRHINADAKLSNLLKLGKEDNLTYFNLQKFMSPHFQKQADKLLENQKLASN